MANEFTGEAFLKALADGALTEPLIRVGMVKLRADSSDEFLFSEAGCGGEWLTVPVDLVEKATFVRMLPCHDHQHPLVVVEFKAPPKEDRAASLFAQLARSAGVHRQAGGEPGPGMSGAARPCNATPPGLPAQATGAPPAGTAGALSGDSLERRAGGLGGLGGLGGQFGWSCIAWHQECRWIELWISSIGRSIPIYVCYDVCDRIGF